MKSEFVKLTKFEGNRHVYIKADNIFRLEEFAVDNKQGAIVTYLYGKSTDCISVQETPEEIIMLTKINII